MAKYEQVQDIWLTKKIYEDAENSHYEGLAKVKMAKHEQDHDIWLTKKIYEDAEKSHYEGLAKIKVAKREQPQQGLAKAALTPLAVEVAKARQKLMESRDNFTAAVASIDSGAFKFMEKKVVHFEKSINEILTRLKSLDTRVSAIEKKLHQAKHIHEINVAAAPKQVEEKINVVDLFSDDEANEAAAKVREERLAAYAAKRSKKPQLIAISRVVYIVTPRKDTNMKPMEERVRGFQCDGLYWGASKVVELASGIKKLIINCVLEDDELAADWLQEALEVEIDDLVQNVDIALLKKI